MSKTLWTICASVYNGRASILIYFVEPSNNTAKGIASEFTLDLYSYQNQRVMARFKLNRVVNRKCPVGSLTHDIGCSTVWSSTVTPKKIRIRVSETKLTISVVFANGYRFSRKAEFRDTYPLSLFARHTSGKLPVFSRRTAVDQATVFDFDLGSFKFTPLTLAKRKANE